MFLKLFFCFCWATIQIAQTSSILTLLNTSKNVTTSVGKEAIFTVDYRHNQHSGLTVTVLRILENGDQEIFASNTKYNISLTALQTDPFDATVKFKIMDVTHEDEGKFSFCFDMVGASVFVDVWLTVLEVPLKPVCAMLSTPSLLAFHIELSCCIVPENFDTNLTWYNGKTNRHIKSEEFPYMRNDSCLNTTLPWNKYNNGTIFRCEATYANGTEICETDPLLIKDDCIEDKTYRCTIVLSIMILIIIILGFLVYSKYRKTIKKLKNHVYMKISKRAKKQRGRAQTTSRNTEATMDLNGQNEVTSEMPKQTSARKYEEYNYDYNKQQSVDNSNQNKMGIVEELGEDSKTNNQMSARNSNRVDDYLTKIHRVDDYLTKVPESEIDKNNDKDEEYISE